MLFPSLQKICRPVHRSRKSFESPFSTNSKIYHSGILYTVIVALSPFNYQRRDERAAGRGPWGVHPWGWCGGPTSRQKLCEISELRNNLSTGDNYTSVQSAQYDKLPVSVHSIFQNHILIGLKAHSKLQNDSSRCPLKMEECARRHQILWRLKRTKKKMLVQNISFDAKTSGRES